jgi:hypothetical protein
VRREYTFAGKPLLAASASLSVDDADRGLCALLLGCELELAMLLLPVLKDVRESTRDDVLLRASSRCEKLGLYQEAVYCLEKLSNDGMRLASAGQMYARLTQMGVIEATEMLSLAETLLQLAGLVLLLLFSLSTFLSPSLHACVISTNVDIIINIINITATTITILIIPVSASIC